MSMKSFVSFIIVAFVFMMGCATVSSVPSSRQPQRTSSVIDAPKDKVWPLLVEEVDSKYPIQAIEKESGSITTQVVEMPVTRGNNSSFRKYVLLERRTGGQFRGPWGGGSSKYEKLRMNMRITATEYVPGKTMINIIAHYEAFSANYVWVTIPSNGSVENQILTNIKVKLE